VRWYIDGQLVHAETGEAAQRLVRPQQLILNLWASEQLGSWVGQLDLGKSPWRLDVSCMAYAPVYAGPICG
jgi:beta-glucanase (GH16 family)